MSRSVCAALILHPQVLFAHAQLAPQKLINSHCKESYRWLRLCDEPSSTNTPPRIGQPACLLKPS